MEHRLSSVDLVRPWRTATIVASAIAVFELVLLVALGVALLGRPVAQSVRAAASERVLAPTAARAPRLTDPRLTRGETAVLVLNGNGRAGAAAEAAARIQSLGYAVASVGNAPRTDYSRTIVMYRSGYRPEAMRLARDLRSRLVAPLDGVPTRALSDARVVLILGTS